MARVLKLTGSPLRSPRRETDPETMERSVIPRRTVAPILVWYGIAGLFFLSVDAAVWADERAEFVQGLQEVIRQADPNLQGRDGRITRSLEGLFEGLRNESAGDTTSRKPHRGGLPGGAPCIQ